MSTDYGEREVTKEYNKITDVILYYILLYPNICIIVLNRRCDGVMFSFLQTDREKLKIKLHIKVFRSISVF